MNELKLHQYLTIALQPSTPCLSINEIFSFFQGDQSEIERERTEEHLLQCPACMDTWRDLRLFMNVETFAKTNRSPKTHQLMKYLAYAACLIMAIGLGAAMGTWWLAPENSLSYSQEVAALVELYPQHMTFRGGPGQLVDRDSIHAGLLSVVLNTDQELPADIRISIENTHGTLVHKISIHNPTTPLCILVPVSLLSSNESSLFIFIHDVQGNLIESFQLKTTKGTVK